MGPRPEHLCRCHGASRKQVRARGIWAVGKKLFREVSKGRGHYLLAFLCPIMVLILLVSQSSRVAPSCVSAFFGFLRALQASCSGKALTQHAQLSAERVGSLSCRCGSVSWRIKSCRFPIILTAFL